MTHSGSSKVEENARKVRISPETAIKSTENEKKLLNKYG